MQIATLQRLAQASSLSYLSLDKIPSSPYYQSSQLRPVVQVVDPQSESGATIFIDDSSIIVACRGSANLKNFGTNLKFGLVPATKLSVDVPEDALVHEGFQDASLGLWNELEPKLLDVLNNSDDEAQKRDIIFTGHSLGGATALLCSLQYNASAQNKSPKLSIVSFGGPKLCNVSFARHLRNAALQDSNILHLVHDKDPVLANNQQLWDSLGYENVGIEMSCDANSPIVYDDKPDGRSFAWNILDHCSYLGVFIGPRISIF